MGRWWLAVASDAAAESPRIVVMFVAVVPGPGLLFGLMLIAGIAGGFAARWVHVPRVVGFLLSGIALRACLHYALESSEEQISAALDHSAIPLAAIRDLALGMILFKVGSVFEKRKLQTLGRTVAPVSVAEAATTFAAVAIGCSVAAFMTTGGSYTFVECMVLGALLAAAAIETAPAATLFILQEYESKGPMSERILAMVGFNNILCIVTFFSLFMLLTAVGVIDTSESIAARPGIVFLALTAGSFVLGVLGGAVLVIAHGKLPLAESLLVFFAMVLVLGAGEAWLMEHVGVSYSFLLTTLVLGAIFANVAVDSDKLKTTINTVGTPIYAGFFVLAGFKLHITDLLHMGLLGGVYLVCRTLGKLGGVKMGARLSGDSDDRTEALGSAMLCQAAVAIGLVAFLDQHWNSPLSKLCGTVVLGSIVIFELAGPLLLKSRVVAFGEVKAITLLRTGRVSDAPPSVFANTIRSIARLLIPWGSHETVAPESLTVEHVMRGNIQLIQASARFDEVLHFVEKSNYGHFPVVHESGQFAGMIHMSELRDLIYDPTLRDLVTAVDLTDGNARVVPVDASLEAVLPVFAEANVSMLPVTEHDDSLHIVGVVEEKDVLKALHIVQAGAKS